MAKSFEGSTRQAIGRRLELTRDLLGLQQNEFALGAGIAPATYNAIEKGNKFPGLEKALAIRRAYGVTLDWIYEGDLESLRDRLSRPLRQMIEAREHQAQTSAVRPKPRARLRAETQ